MPAMLLPSGAFPAAARPFWRWGVGTIKHRPTLERPGRRSHAGAWERSARANDQHGGRDAPVGPGVGRRGQWGGVEQGRGGGQTGTARQRRLPGRVGRWRQAGRSGLGFAATGHGGQTGQTGAEEQHGGGFRDGGSRLQIEFTPRSIVCILIRVRFGV